LNFRFIFILIFITGCGVKSDPVPPPGTAIPSYESQYLQTDQSGTEQNKKNKKKSESN